jgi:hypothetical protein
MTFLFNGVTLRGSVSFQLVDVLAALPDASGHRPRPRHRSGMSAFSCIPDPSLRLQRSVFNPKLTGPHWPANHCNSFITRISPMSDNVDDAFFERADAHIRLSNEQLKDASRSKVSASMMFSTARFNAWVIAGGVQSVEEMSQSRDETIRYFVEQYKLMLEENVNDYIKNFENYMKAPGGNS